MARVSRAALLALVAITLPVRAQSPAPQPTFRGGTDLVQVDVSVLDGKRHPVRGLTAADFSIFEDGQPREIQAFTEVNLPDRVQSRDAAWTREVPSDVATNLTAQEEGRLLIIVLDRTIPVGEPAMTARRIAAAAINQLGPGDLAAVVSTNNGAVQNLTADHTRLLHAITASDLSSDISDVGKEIEAEVFALTGRTWSTLNDGRCQCGRACSKRSRESPMRCRRPGHVAKCSFSLAAICCCRRRTRPESRATTSAAAIASAMRETS